MYITFCGILSRVYWQFISDIKGERSASFFKVAKVPTECKQLPQANIKMEAGITAFRNFGNKLLINS